MLATYIHTNIHTYERTTEAYLYYKLTKEPKGSGKLKSQRCTDVTTKPSSPVSNELKLASENAIS